MNQTFGGLPSQYIHNIFLKFRTIKTKKKKTLIVVLTVLKLILEQLGI
jgi:hypothetical protein